MEKETAVATQFTTALSQYCGTYADLVARDFTDRGLQFSEYSKTCAMSAMSAIYDLVTSDGKFKMDNLNKSNLKSVITMAASLQLNASATPRECYFQVRNKKIGNSYVPTVEMGIEGDGNDAMLRNFGVDVQKVYPCWLVREGDEFTYPKHIGLDVEPPTWEQHGSSERVDKVVYPVQLSESVEYLIAERESVRVNLMAHIKNNLMNETFGICENRYKANDEHKKKINEKKQEVLEIARDCETVDEILDCKELHPWISAAWLDTPESMIVRKMRNNAIKKFPKSLNSMAVSSLNEIDMTYQNVQQEIEDNANKEEFVVAEPHPQETHPEPEKVQGEVEQTDPIQNQDDKPDWM